MINSGWRLAWIFTKERVSSKRYSISTQGLHRFEKYLNIEGFLEKYLKIKSALKSSVKLLKGLEKSLNSTIFCRACRVPTSSGNHGKPGKSPKTVPCMEKSLNLKKKLLNNRGKIMEFCKNNLKKSP